jgi:hypothetical protein
MSVMEMFRHLPHGDAWLDLQQGVSVLPQA